jgi:hypothetical protein
VLSSTIPDQGFQAVTGRDPQVLQGGGDEPWNAHTFSESLGVRAAERSDLAQIIT